MDWISMIIEALRANPSLAVGIGVVAMLAYVLLQRRPKIQREADERLSALRRDKADQYTKLRRPR
jgi:hypothetical protein